MPSLAVQATALLMPLMLFGASSAAAQTILRASVTNNGSQISGHSVGGGLVNGRWVPFRSEASNVVPGDTNGSADGFVRDLLRGTTARVTLGNNGQQANNDSLEPHISADGRYVAFGSLASNLVAGDTNGTWDIFVRDMHVGTTMRVSVSSAGTQSNGQSDVVFLSANGRFVVFRSFATNLVAGDTNGDTDVFLHDRQTGLTERISVGTGAPPNGAGDDADGDGVSNAAEYQAGTHPRGFSDRYLAEGATGTFFDAQLALLNPGAAEAIALLRFSRDGGATLNVPVVLPPRTRRTVAVDDIPGLEEASFSTTLESDLPVVVDRTMSWDATGYGSHAESGVSSPALTWYLAEGSTSGEFALFYLLQNPQSEPVDATIRYLLPFGQPPIEKNYRLEPLSRRTIAVDGEGDQLAATDVSAVITGTSPIIVERAMYISRPGQVLAAGHGSVGVTAPATRWFLAEGATGPFFDMFILLANPSDTAAAVHVDYLLSTGEVLGKDYVVPANGRETIFVDAEQLPAGSGATPLRNVAVSSSISVTNDIPIVVERTMWWPSPETSPNFWTETHNSMGSTTTGSRWALAEGEVGGPRNAETYILIANTSDYEGEARVTLLFEDGTTVERKVRLLPRSRQSVNVSADFETANKRFGAIVESLGAAPAQIVVERAMYTSPGGQTWAAGTNALATRLQ